MGNKKISELQQAQALTNNTILPVVNINTEKTTLFEIKNFVNNGVSGGKFGLEDDVFTTDRDVNFSGNSFTWTNVEHFDIVGEEFNIKTEELNITGNLTLEFISLSSADMVFFLDGSEIAISALNNYSVVVDYSGDIELGVNKTFLMEDSVGAQYEAEFTVIEVIDEGYFYVHTKFAAETQCLSVQKLVDHRAQIRLDVPNGTIGEFNSVLFIDDNGLVATGYIPAPPSVEVSLQEVVNVGSTAMLNDGLFYVNNTRSGSQENGVVVMSNSIYGAEIRDIRNYNPGSGGFRQQDSRIFVSSQESQTSPNTFKQLIDISVDSNGNRYSSALKLKSEPLGDSNFDLFTRKLIAVNTYGEAGISGDTNTGLIVRDSILNTGFVYDTNMTSNQLGNDRAITDVGGVKALIESNGTKFGSGDDLFTTGDRNINFDTNAFSWTNVGGFSIKGVEPNFTPADEETHMDNDGNGYYIIRRNDNAPIGGVDQSGGILYAVIEILGFEAPSIIEFEAYYDEDNAEWAYYNNEPIDGDVGYLGYMDGTGTPPIIDFTLPTATFSGQSSVFLDGNILKKGNTQFGIGDNFTPGSDDRQVDMNKNSLQLDQANGFSVYGYEQENMTQNGFYANTREYLVGFFGDYPEYDALDTHSMLVANDDNNYGHFIEFPFKEGNNFIDFIFNDGNNNIEITFSRLDLYVSDLDFTQIIFISDEILAPELTYVGYNYSEHIYPLIGLDLEVVEEIPTNSYTYFQNNSGGISAGPANTLVKFASGFNGIPAIYPNGIKLGGELQYDMTFIGQHTQTGNVNTNGEYYTSMALSQSTNNNIGVRHTAGWQRTNSSVYQNVSDITWRGNSHSVNYSNPNTGENNTLSVYAGYGNDSSSLTTYKPIYSIEKANIVDGQSVNQSFSFDFFGNIILRDDTNSKGIEYYADYSATFTDRSLVDKAYVDSVAGGGGGAGDLQSVLTAGATANIVDGTTQVSIQNRYSEETSPTGQDIFNSFIVRKDGTQNVSYASPFGSYLYSTTEISTGTGGGYSNLKLHSQVGTHVKELIMNTGEGSDVGILVYDTNYIGLIGLEYYGDNATELSYVQKKYVDDAIAAGGGGSTPNLGDVITATNISGSDTQMPATNYIDLKFGVYGVENQSRLSFGGEGNGHVGDGIGLFRNLSNGQSTGIVLSDNGSGGEKIEVQDFVNNKGLTTYADYSAAQKLDDNAYASVKAVKELIVENTVDVMFAVNESVTIAQTASDLNTLYPSAGVYFTLYCPNIGTGVKYVKITNGGQWMSFEGTTLS